MSSTAARAAVALALSAVLTVTVGSAANAAGPAAGTVSPVGSPLVNGDQTGWAAISADGRYAAYYTGSPWWLDSYQLFLVDLATGTEKIVTGGGDTDMPWLSADGRYLGYTNETSTVARIYDQTTKTTVDLVPPAGTKYNKSLFEALGSDGRFAAYSVSDIPYSASQYRVRDRVTGADEAVTPKPAAGRTQGKVGLLGISTDGSKVAYEFQYDGTSPDKGDLYVNDRATGATRQVDVTYNGGQANGTSTLVRISDDGTSVYFNSAATNIVANAVPAGVQSYRRDLTTNRTVHVGPELDAVTSDGRTGVGKENGLVYKLDLAAGTRTEIGNSKQHWYTGQAIGAGGKALLFTTNDKAITGIDSWYPGVYVRRFE